MSDDAVPTGTIHRMDIREFRQAGYLQEANRLFFHPLGLALEIVIEEDGSSWLGGIHDHRSDPEGCAFIDLTDPADDERATFVRKEFLRRADARKALFGRIVQPIGSKL